MAGTPIVPATPSPIRSSTTGPADGELANAASVNGAFQDLMEGVLGLRLASYGRRAQIHVRSSNGTTLIVGALGSVILTTGGGSTWLSFLNTTQQTVTAATAFGGALGNLTRYFLYAYNNAGALDFIVTTTAPDASRTYENGNTDRVFISTFITDGSGIIVPFTHVGNQYHYGPALDYATFGGRTALRIFNLNTNTQADYDLSTLVVPSWATSAVMQYFASADVNFGAFTKGVTANGYLPASGMSEAAFILTGNNGNSPDRGFFHVAFPALPSISIVVTFANSGYLILGLSSFTF